ncbi:MAG: DNA alkylation repair protein [Flavobacterium sp.]
MKNSVYRNFYLLDSMLLPHADREAAVGMAKYMKNHFPFLGIPVTLRKEILRDFKKSAISNEIIQWDFIRYLHQQSCREYHYFAMELAKLKVQKKPEISDIEHITIMLQTNAWWDTVDFLAAHVLGIYLKKFPEKITEVLDQYTLSKHLWLQRSTLLFSLFYKQETDWELLKKQVLLLQNQKDFFIQKAIGWSLRQYAKTNALRVFTFVNSIDFQGNNLAKKEALKHF